ncbi:MAG TPA: hypothetical protein VFI09_00845 [Solirubrobacterales bacterium]|nr:hypothetical protein [Solirubrobacterales bacterium]
MADENPTGPGTAQRPTNADQDDRDQAATLRKILFIYPESMTLAELTRELTAGTTDFQERDRIEGAVRDLVAGGLLHRVGDLVLPTRAAVNFYLLEEV